MFENLFNKKKINMTYFWFQAVNEIFYFKNNIVLNILCNVIKYSMCFQIVGIISIKLLKIKWELYRFDYNLQIIEITWNYNHFKNH